MWVETFLRAEAARIMACRTQGYSWRSFPRVKETLGVAECKEIMMEKINDEQPAICGMRNIEYFWITNRVVSGSSVRVCFWVRG